MLRLLSTAALLVVLAAGCGATVRSERTSSHGVPRGLARGWGDRAEAIAAAAAAGNDCRARHLARSLQDDVVQARHEVPLRLQAPLLVAVNSLVARIMCTAVATNPAPSAKPHPPDEGSKRKPPKKHGPHDRDKGDGKGHGG